MRQLSDLDLDRSVGDLASFGSSCWIVDGTSPALPTADNGGTGGAPLPTTGAAAKGFHLPWISFTMTVTLATLLV